MGVLMLSHWLTVTQSSTNSAVTEFGFRAPFIYNVNGNTKYRRFLKWRTLPKEKASRVWTETLETKEEC